MVEATLKIILVNGTICFYVWLLDTIRVKRKRETEENFQRPLSKKAKIKFFGALFQTLRDPKKLTIPSTFRGNFLQYFLYFK